MGWKENTIKWLKDRAADCEHKDKTRLGEDCPIESGYHSSLALIDDLKVENARLAKKLAAFGDRRAGGPQNFYERRIAALEQELAEAKKDSARLVERVEKANDAYLGIKADYTSARQAWHRAYDLEVLKLSGLLRRSLDLDFDNASAVLDSFKDEVRAAIDDARKEQP